MQILFEIDSKINYTVFTGMVKRQCNDHANWQAPDFSGCTSDEYANLNENVSPSSLQLT